MFVSFVQLHEQQLEDFRLILQNVTNPRGVQKLFSTTLCYVRYPQLGFHSLGRRLPALDLVTGLIIRRRLVAVVLRRRVGPGTASGRPRPRVGRPRVPSLFRAARRVRVVATRRVLIWGWRDRETSNDATRLVLVPCGGARGSPLTDLVGAAV